MEGRGGDGMRGEDNTSVPVIGIQQCALSCVVVSFTCRPGHSPGKWSLIALLAQAPRLLRPALPMLMDFDN